MQKLSPSGYDIQVITPQDYLEHRSSEDIILVDVRRLVEYKAGHIPGAISMPFTNFIKMQGLALYPADADNLRRHLYESGITKDKLVICYDNLHWRHASRVLYTLELLGYERLAVLGATYDRYVELGYEVERGTGEKSMGSVNEAGVAADYRYIITKETILELVNHKHDVTLVDTRAAADYVFGHIPTALNLPWQEVASSDKVFNLSKVEEFTKELGIRKDEPIIFYCEEGTSSSLVMYAFRQLGYKNTHTYLPSYSEWISDPQLPVCREED